MLIAATDWLTVIATGSAAVAAVAGAVATIFAGIAIRQARGAGRDANRSVRLDRLADVSRWVEELALLRDAVTVGGLIGVDGSTVRLAITSLRHALAAAPDVGLPACGSMSQVDPLGLDGLSPTTIAEARAELREAMVQARTR
jgi:hypothetical protein